MIKKINQKFPERLKCPVSFMVSFELQRRYYTSIYKTMSSYCLWKFNLLFYCFNISTTGKVYFKMKSLTIWCRYYFLHSVRKWMSNIIIVLIYETIKVEIIASSLIIAYKVKELIFYHLAMILVSTIFWHQFFFLATGIWASARKSSDEPKITLLVNFHLRNTSP